MMIFNKRNLIPALGKIALLLIVLACGKSLSAQETADKIIAVIGRNRIILQSDLETEAAQEKQQVPNFTDSMKCLLLQQMIMRKMLAEQAERDSVFVTDDDVEGQLENRLRYFIQLYGSKEKLEEASGKTVFQIKEEYRDAIREQMVAEKLQGTVLENVKVTPAEVERFYNKIPVDSLPFFPATVELGQIVIDPPVNPEMNDYARQKMEGIRNDIVNNGKNFEIEAGIYSDDPGSRDNGGRYDGITRTGPWAPEFIAAAFKLQNGDISPVFKTKFGYHIIQMISRKGDEADLRHILIKPELTSADFQKALNTLDSVRQILVAGKMTFPEAVGKFSTDEAAKRTGGMVADPTTGNTDLEITKLDPDMIRILDTLGPGSYSMPQIFITDEHEKSCRIVYLRSRTSPHKASLKDDYSKIQQVALGQKKNEKMLDWVTEKLPTFYLKIAPEYQTCDALKRWIKDSDSSK
jgi:peptidyl-prolyl cis-trans isomerase SurA